MLTVVDRLDVKEKRVHGLGKVEAYGAFYAGRPWCDSHLQRVSKFFGRRLEHIDDWSITTISCVLRIHGRRSWRGGGVVVMCRRTIHADDRLILDGKWRGHGNGEQFFQEHACNVDKYETVRSL